MDQLTRSIQDGAAAGEPSSLFICQPCTSSAWHSCCFHIMLNTTAPCQFLSHPHHQTTPTVQHFTRIVSVFSIMSVTVGMVQSGSSVPVPVVYMKTALMMSSLAMMAWSDFVHFVLSFSHHSFFLFFHIMHTDTHRILLWWSFFSNLYHELFIFKNMLSGP